MVPFSPRPDTALENARDKVPESIRDERAAILRDLSVKLNRDYIQRQIGKNAEIILEGRRLGHWHGLTGNYMKLDVLDVPDGASVGDLFKVTVLSENEAKVMR